MSIQIGAHNTHEIVNNLTVAPSITGDSPALHWMAVELDGKWVHIDLRELGIITGISWPLKENFKASLSQLTRRYVTDYSSKEEMNNITGSIKMVLSNLISTSGTEKVLAAARQEIKNIETTGGVVANTENLNDEQQNRITLLEGLLMDMDSYNQEDKDYMQSPFRDKVLTALPEIEKNFR